MGRALHALGLFCARRSLVMIGAWVVLVVLVFGSVAKFGAETSNDLTLPGTGSQSVKDLLEDRFPPQQNGTNPIVFDIKKGKLTDKANKSAINASIKAMKKAPHVYSVTNPLSSAGQTAGLLSKDKQTAFAPVLLDVGSGDLDMEIGAGGLRHHQACAGRRHQGRGRGVHRQRALRATDREQRGRRHPRRDVHPDAGPRQPGRHGDADHRGRRRSRDRARDGRTDGPPGRDAGHGRDPGDDDRPGSRHRLRPVPDHATSGTARGRYAGRGLDRPRRRHLGKRDRVRGRHRRRRPACRCAWPASPC